MIQKSCLHWEYSYKHPSYYYVRRFLHNSLTCNSSHALIIIYIERMIIRVTTA